MRYNDNLSKISESLLSKFNNEISLIDNITLLTYGESDIPVSKNIKTQLINSLLSNNDKYCSSQGLLSTRNVIINLINNKYNTSFNEENILLTYGATEALFLTISSIINKNDEVLIPKPCYPLYDDIVKYIGGKTIYIKYDNNYHIDINDLKNKINKKTKLLILNYPNNPTGICLNQIEINEIKKIIIKYNILLILDNVYDEIIFNTQPNILNEKEIINNTIIINSLSKSQSLTGWRLGYLIANKKIVSLTKKLHEMITICMPYFLMDSMKYALINQINVSYYKKNSDYVINILKKLHLKYIKPEGGFYVCFNIEEFNIDSVSFCKLAAYQYKLGLIPGNFFNFENFVRISISVDYKKLVIGMKKLKKTIISLRKNIAH